MICDTSAQFPLGFPNPAVTVSYRSNAREQTCGHDTISPSFERLALYSFYSAKAWRPAAATQDTSAGQPSGLPGDFLLFPDLTGIVRYDQEPRKKFSNGDVIPAINVFYTADYQGFRFLGEWLVSTKTHNLERFQLGAHLGEDATIWLGRFHNPIGYWNMQFHHGAFLQTTISRPGIMAFETAGGVIPNHLTGFLWEGLHQQGEGGLYYTVGAGAGPQINKGLEAFNLVEPGGSHRPGASFRLGYQPVSYGIDEVGVSGAYNQIHSDELAVKNVT